MCGIDRQQGRLVMKAEKAEAYPASVRFPFLINIFFFEEIFRIAVLIVWPVIK